MKSGAITFPMEAPALKIPCAMARSFSGNHSALLFTAPGQFPASEIPSVTRTNVNDITPLTAK
ncbi:hypothetical protein D3C80_1687040 [compost metagenome]